MNKSLLKNDDLILRDDAGDKMKRDDDLRAAAEKLKRDQPMDEVFLLYPGSRELLDGKPSGNHTLSATMIAFGLLGLVAMLALIGFALNSGFLPVDGSIASAAVLSLMAIMGGFFGWMTVISLKQFFEDREFDRNAVLLTGTLTSISGCWRTFTRRSKTPHYSVTVVYEVELPSGTFISDTAESTRPDLVDDSLLPQKGTPVAILYSPRYKRTRLL